MGVRTEKGTESSVPLLLDPGIEIASQEPQVTTDLQMRKSVRAYGLVDPARANCEEPRRCGRVEKGLPQRPAAGRPREAQAGPSFFCTWRPLGSRYFAYQTGPR